MVEHRNVVRLVKNTNFIEFNPCDRILQTGALEFDASTFEIWGALLNGLVLVLASKEKLLEAEILKEITTKQKITIMWITSSFFNLPLVISPFQCESADKSVRATQAKPNSNGGGGDGTRPHLSYFQDSNVEGVIFHFWRIYFWRVFSDLAD